MNRSPSAPLLVAASAGLVHAAASLYWALGGTWLLDTVGGAARGVQSLPVGASTVLVVAAVAKGALALAPLRLAVSRVPAVRGLLGLLALALGAYGVLLTVAGLVALTGILGPVEAPLALAGHALLWDPLFAVWGVALGVGLHRTRGSVVRTRPAPARLGVTAPALGRQPALLARAGGPRGSSGGWGRSERLAEQGGHALARRDAVASL